jgi:Ribosomal protein S13/S18
MARIAGVNLPNQKRLEIGLTYIYGIGQSRARIVCAALGLSPDTKVRDLTDDQAPGRDRRVPGDPPPPRPAGQRSAHEDERTHAQGPEEDGRQRKEGQVDGPAS